MPIFPERINECITPYALGEIREQRCQRMFVRGALAWECHDIADALLFDSQWIMDRRDIDPHWYFERPQHLGPQPALRLDSQSSTTPSAVNRIREPLVVRRSGRPRADDTKFQYLHLPKPILLGATYRPKSAPVRVNTCTE
jgi:hypothetical protein